MVQTITMNEATLVEGMAKFVAEDLSTLRGDANWWHQRVRLVEHWLRDETSRVIIPDDGTEEMIRRHIQRGDSHPRAQCKCWKHIVMELRDLPCFAGVVAQTKTSPVNGSPNRGKLRPGKNLIVLSDEKCSEISSNASTHGVDNDSNNVSSSWSLEALNPEIEPPVAVKRTRPLSSAAYLSRREVGIETVAIAKKFAEMSLLERQMEWLKKKQDKMEAERLRQTQENERELTFQPKLIRRITYSGDKYFRDTQTPPSSSRSFTRSESSRGVGETGAALLKERTLPKPVGVSCKLLDSMKSELQASLASSRKEEKMPLENAPAWSAKPTIGGRRADFDSSETKVRLTLQDASKFELSTMYRKTDRRAGRDGVALHVGRREDTLEEQVIAVLFDREKVTEGRPSSGGRTTNTVSPLSSSRSNREMTKLEASCSKSLYAAVRGESGGRGEAQRCESRQSRDGCNGSTGDSVETENATEICQEAEKENAPKSDPGTTLIEKRRTKEIARSMSQSRVSHKQEEVRVGRAVKESFKASSNSRAEIAAKEAVSRRAKSTRVAVKTASGRRQQKDDKELLETKPYGRFVTAGSTSSDEDKPRENGNKDRSSDEKQGVFFEGVSSVQHNSDESMHFMEDEGVFAQNFSSISIEDEQKEDESPAEPNEDRENARPNENTGATKPETPRKSANHQEAEEDDELTSSPVKKKVARNEPHAPERPSTSQTRRDTSKSLYPLLPKTRQHAAASKAQAQYLRYKLSLKNHLQELRQREASQRQHLERAYKSGEHTANVDKIRSRRFEQDVRLHRIAIGLEAKNEEEKQLRQAMNHLLGLEKEKLREEHRLTTSMLKQIQKEHAEREQAMENFYANQIQLVKEQTRREAMERELVEKAQRSASEQMMRELRMRESTS
ncbi:hypothetical protein GQ600_1057 [Phytophthora cactorum]|nr:hypothetical protein GQ600_1057 [Phytophthora cactorum]